MYYGIDVSSHNGIIDWSKLKEEIDFAMLRVGYGKNNIDSKFARNADECNKYGIPFGGYWFSYALDSEMAKKEGEYCCKIIKKYNPTMPVAYDWEYDSDKYAKQKGKNITPADIATFATNFLDVVEKNGFAPMVYSNSDYLNKGISSIVKKYPLWYAKWSGYSPDKNCLMWQYTDKEKYDGISGNVDADAFYGTIGAKEFIPNSYDDLVHGVISKIPKEWWLNYQKAATDVICGKYGNGDTRKKKLKEAGYDAQIVQLIVNELVR